MPKYLKHILAIAGLGASAVLAIRHVRKRPVDFIALKNIVGISNMSADAMVCGKTRDFLREQWGEPFHSYARADFWEVGSQFVKVLYNADGIAIQCDNELDHLLSEDEAHELLTY